MTGLRDAAEMALEALDANDKLINGTKTHGGLVFAMDGYYSGTFDIDETNQQTEQAITALRQALAEEAMAHVWEQKEEQPWVKTYAGGKPNYCTPVDAVNISEERVDETAKGEHEPVAFVNGYFGGYLTITCFDSTLVLPDGLPLYTAPQWIGLSDDEREHFRKLGFVGVLAVENKLKEKNGG